MSTVRFEVLGALPFIQLVKAACQILAGQAPPVGVTHTKTTEQSAQLPTFTFFSGPLSLEPTVEVFQFVLPNRDSFACRPGTLNLTTTLLGLFTPERADSFYNGYTTTTTNYRVQTTIASSDVPMHSVGVGQLQVIWTGHSLHFIGGLSRLHLLMCSNISRGLACTETVLVQGTTARVYDASEGSTSLVSKTPTYMPTLSASGYFDGTKLVHPLVPLRMLHHGRLTDFGDNLAYGHLPSSPMDTVELGGQPFISVGDGFWVKPWPV